MLIDFSTILFLLSMATFLIWLLDACFWQGKRDKDNAEANNAIGASESMGEEVSDEKRKRILKQEGFVTEHSKAFFPILVVVLILRSFITEPFRIPTPSMVPTLLPGDFILVSKSAYGFRLPVVNHRVGRLIKPKVGDVVVFRFPLEPTTNYIKRLVGVPGDVIEYKGKSLTINGKILKYRYDGTYNDTGAGQSANQRNLRKEVLGNVVHDILTKNQPDLFLFPCLKEGKFTVPKGEYFVMGDNRDNSADSRFWCGVPEKNLVGRAYAIWMNWDPALSSLRWERVFKNIE
ncbi:Signal peptidase I [hydrothermal vent metagenome]|uniref:signal peptidase I n=1 Tax=hydrothermal vent metagenome TaxID=652676 RepID=A0A3B0Z0I1_9ZZZZ